MTGVRVPATASSKTKMRGVGPKDFPLYARYRIHFFLKKSKQLQPYPGAIQNTKLDIPKSYICQWDYL